MTIEITEFTNVSIAVTPAGVSVGNFGILGFLTNEEGIVGTAERARSYTSLASVGDDWATTTEVYKAATAFYAQTPTPKDFTVLMCFETDQAATLTGGGHDEIAELVTINGTGVLSLTVDSTPVSISDLDLSTATTLDEAAALVQTAISAVAAGATCIHNGLQFVVQGVVTGALGDITFATGDAAEALGFAQYQGALSPGLDAETPVDALAAALTQGIKFIGLVTHKKYRDITGQAVNTNTIDIARWAEAAKKIFCNTSNNLAMLSSVITTDIASQLKDSTLRFSMTTFSKDSNLYPSASVFGRAASVNFESIGSTLTLNLKQMPTISAEDLTPGEFAVLRSKYASAVVKIGDSVNAFTDSRVASGSWLDTTHGLLWLENRAETDMFNLLYVEATKVPFTQAGINMTVARLDFSLQAAVRNGLCAPGFLPSGEFLPKGYKIVAVELGDVTVGDKGNRIYQGLSFEMVGAGALHEVVVQGAFSE